MGIEYDNNKMPKDQFLMSIRRDGNCLGYIEYEDGKIKTTGQIGNNVYDDFVELIYGLQGYDISIDNFYF